MPDHNARLRHREAVKARQERRDEIREAVQNEIDDRARDREPP